MANEEEQKKEKEEGHDANSGNKSEEDSLVSRANAAAERLEKANEENRKLVERWEAVQARARLGGKSEGPQQEQEKVETPSEYVKRIEQELRDKAGGR